MSSVCKRWKPSTRHMIVEMLTENIMTVLTWGQEVHIRSHSYNLFVCVEFHYSTDLQSSCSDAHFTKKCVACRRNKIQCVPAHILCMHSGITASSCYLNLLFVRRKHVNEMSQPCPVVPPPWPWIRGCCYLHCRLRSRKHWHPPPLHLCGVYTGQWGTTSPPLTGFVKLGLWK